MKASIFRRNSAWVTAYITKHPDATLTTIAKAANNAGYPLARDSIADLKASAIKREAAKVAASPSVIPNAPLRPVMCVRCGGVGHWASACTVPNSANGVEVLNPPGGPALIAFPIPDPAGPRMAVRSLEAIEAAQRQLESERTAAIVASTEADKRELADMEREVRERAEAAKAAAAHVQSVVAEIEREAAKPAPKPTPAPAPKRKSNTLMRRARLNELLDADPSMPPQAAQVKLWEEFGIALGIGYIVETCAAAREIAGLPPLRTIAKHTKTQPGSPRAVEADDPNVVDEEALVEAETRQAVRVGQLATPTNPDEEVASLARLAGDLMRAHGISDLRLVVVAGEADWEFSFTKTNRGSTKV